MYIKTYHSTNKFLIVSVGATAILLLLFTAYTPASSFQADTSVQVEVVEKLGETIPLDLTFTDMEGRPVTLRELIDKPTVLTLVYYRCPNICSPLLQELGDTVEQCELEPGPEYNLITISFDPRETPELSKIAHQTIVGMMERKIPADSWRFMTGDAENIAKITEAVGFRYVRVDEDFSHPATVIFLSDQGKIVRYLNGLTFLPADIKLALLDAKEGKARSFMQKFQRICYTYDPQGKKYVLQINRIILVFSLILAAGFLSFLLWQGSKRKQAALVESAPADPDQSEPHK